MPPASRSAPAESAADRLVALADRCVQCGLCLPACPTYGLDRTESESPRGRIALARAWERGTVPATPQADAHLDHCLGCRSCEAVCPAGVAYGELLVEARTRQRDRRGTNWRQAVIEWLSARPRLMMAALGAYRHLFPALPATLRRLPRPASGEALRPVHSDGPPAETAMLFTGCIANAYEGGLQHAVVRLGAAAGTHIEVAAPGCCGSLHVHGGHMRQAQQLTAANRARFAGATQVLTVASGCHEALRAALSGTETTDAIDYLSRRANRLAFRPRHERVTLHLPCTQRNVVNSVASLRGLLARVPGLEVVELTAGYGCCGAAGAQMLLEPGRAAAFRQPLIEAFERSGATRLLSANIGCRLHFANATSRPVEHPLEFLAGCLA